MTYPALRELMFNFLHQDFDLVGTIDDNVDAFMRDFPDLAPQLPAEVDDLSAACADDAGIRDTVVALGCQLRPTEGTYRAWLQQIADRVRAATA